MSIEKLYQYFRNYFPLNAEEAKELGSLFTERIIKRRQFILQQDDICRHFTFVISGCLKMYATDKIGKQHNIQFAAENDWITDLSSFYAEQPSKLYIEAIESTVILQITHGDLLKLYVKYHTIDHNFRVIIEQKYIELENRILQNISSTAEERYLLFLDQYQGLSKKLPNTQIASYLGITPEFLSTIRKGLARKNS
jgi:CRP-like cAMP-binding protein